LVCGKRPENGKLPANEISVTDFEPAFLLTQLAKDPFESLSKFGLAQFLK
jgi:hypothetical protein